MAHGAAPLHDGEILAGKYRVLFAIGEGGMGHVYVAEHMQLGHKVALKVLRPSALESEEAVARFVREGRAAARLQSVHTARVSDVGTLDSGVPYMVMEFLEGRDLAQILDEQRTLPIDEAVGFIIQASEAIAEAHRHGIVHRDLKPANLFVTTSLDGAPLVKVLDFGISKASSAVLGAAVQAITTTSAIIGSPKYMSPEQMQDSRTVDDRADIWALGAILYEALTGRVPFEAPTLATMCVQILQVNPARVRLLREEVPEQLEAAVMRCLQKSPDDRFATVAELVQALAPFAPEHEALAARIGRMKDPRSFDATPLSRRGRLSPLEPASAPAMVAARRERRKAAWWGAAIVAVIALGGLAVARMQGDLRTGAGLAASTMPLPPGPAADMVSTVATAVLAAPSILPAGASAAAAEPSVAPVPSTASAPSAAPPAVPPPLRRVLPRPRPSSTPGVTDSVLEDRR